MVINTTRSRGLSTHHSYQDSRFGNDQLVISQDLPSTPGTSLLTSKFQLTFLFHHCFAETKSSFNYLKPFDFSQRDVFFSNLVGFWNDFWAWLFFSIFRVTYHVWTLGCYCNSNKLRDQLTQQGWKMDPEWRCISYWKWGYSSAMLVYQRAYSFGGCQNPGTKWVNNHIYIFIFCYETLS